MIENQERGGEATYSCHWQSSHCQTMRRTDKALIFPWKKTNKYISFPPPFLRSYRWRDIFDHVNCYSIVFSTVQTGSDNDSPSSQLSQATDWEQAESPSRTPWKMAKLSKTPSAASGGRQRSLAPRLLIWKNNFLKGETGRERCGSTNQLPSLKPIKWQPLRCPSARQTAFYFSHHSEGGKEQRERRKESG